MKNNPQTKTYLASALLGGILLIIVAIVNWQEEYILVAIVESTLGLIFLASIVPAYKGKYITTFGNLLLYLVGVVVLYTMTTIDIEDPSPYVALASILLAAYFLMETLRSLIIYSSILFTGFLALTFFDYADISHTATIKFSAIYIAIILIILMNKRFDRLELVETKDFAQKMFIHNEELHIEKEKSEKAKLALEKALTSAEEAITGAERLNKSMVGRELKMAELKKKIEKLEKSRDSK